MTASLGGPKIRAMNVSDIIEKLGGTTAVARLCKVAPPSVSEWRSRNVIPRARLMYLELLRPDVFGGAVAARPRRKAA